VARERRVNRPQFHACNTQVAGARGLCLPPALPEKRYPISGTKAFEEKLIGSNLSQGIKQT
jgi:hypothetical protein